MVAGTSEQDARFRTMSAFTADQVCRLTGLSPRQLSYWDRTGFFSPQYAHDDRKRVFSRIYSFRDVVGLRTLAQLRQTIPLQELRRVGEWLKQEYQDPWAEVTFYIAGRRVFFDDPRVDGRVAGHPLGQMVFPIEMKQVAREMDEQTKLLRERSADDIGQIRKSRNVVHNAPVLAGTRIPTVAIWSLYQSGYDIQRIISEYPSLTENDIRAALDYEEEQQRVRRAG